MYVCVCVVENDKLPGFTCEPKQIFSGGFFFLLDNVFGCFLGYTYTVAVRLTISGHPYKGDSIALVCFYIW